MHRINDVYETVLKLYLNGRKQKKKQFVLSGICLIFFSIFFNVVNSERGCYCDDLLVCFILCAI